MIYCILLYMVSMQWCPREGKNKEDENRWCFPKWRRGTKFISVFWWWWCWWCWQLLPIMMKTIKSPKNKRDRGKFPSVSWRWRCWCWWWRQRKGKCCCRLSASAHQSLCSFYLSKVTDGFQTDLLFMCSSSISPSLFSLSSVCPTSVPSRDDHQSLQNWKFPQNPGSRQNLNSAPDPECDLRQKWNFSGKEKCWTARCQRCMPRWMRLSNL